jgi:hypothetical protein
MAGMVWWDQAGVTRSQDVIRGSYTMALEAESCRRLVAPSCRGRFGYVPTNTMDVLRAYRGRLGEAVVIMAGYDDVSIVDAVPQIMAETEAQGVKNVIWLTFPLNVPYVLPSGFPARNLYANHNGSLYYNSLNHPTMRLADWNVYSRGHPDWFGGDGIHLTGAGAVALAWFIKAQLDLYVVPPPPPPTPPPTTPAPPPPPTTVADTTTTTTVAVTTTLPPTTTTTTAATTSSSTP